MSYDDEVLEKIIKKIDTMTDDDLYSLKSLSNKFLDKLYPFVPVESSFVYVQIELKKDIEIPVNVSYFDTSASVYTNGNDDNYIIDGEFEWKNLVA